MLKAIVNAIVPGRRSLADLGVQLEAAAAELRAAQAEHAQACLAAEEHAPGADKSREQARAACDRAQARCDELMAAIDAATARELNDHAGRAVERREEAGRQRFAAAERRAEAARALSEATGRYADAYHKVLELSAELAGLLPSGCDRAAAAINVSDLETLARLELVRQGVPWAFSHPWGVVSIQPLPARFEGIAAMVREWE